MLEIKNISTGYGKKQVLFDVSFHVKQGEIVLLSGGNGSGKSTILKCIYNLLPLWGGKILYKGKSTTRLKTSDMIKKGIVYIPQKNNYFDSLTVAENLQVSGSVYTKSIKNEKINAVYSEIPKLFKQKNRTPFDLSGGERQLLAFGIALIHEPTIIMFDEPLAGLDRKNTQRFLDKIVQLNQFNNIGFLIIEHLTKFTIEINYNEIKLKLGKISNLD